MTVDDLVSKFKEMKFTKIDDFMADVDLTEPFIDPNNNTKYLIGKCLGKGGFAKVYLANESLLVDYTVRKRPRQVAVKLIPRKRIQRDDQKLRIDNELAIHTSLDHPNIAKMFSSFADSVKICLVLEYCENLTLADVIKSYHDKCIPEYRAVKLFSQLISALIYLHELGIVHRDIKLGNILMQGSMIKLADFGLAVYYPKTEQKHICGTPNFLAPEVFRTKKHSPPSDIWAAGCVLYTMLVGRSPFRFTTMSETAKKIKSVNYDLPNELSLAARQCLRAILTDKPEKRYTPAQIQRSTLFVNHLPISQSQRGLTVRAFSDSTNVFNEIPPAVPPKPKTFSIMEPHKEQKINRI